MLIWIGFCYLLSQPCRINSRFSIFVFILKSFRPNIYKESEQNLRGSLWTHILILHVFLLDALILRHLETLWALQIFVVFLGFSPVFFSQFSILGSMPETIKLGDFPLSLSPTTNRTTAAILQNGECGMVTSKCLNLFFLKSYYCKKSLKVLARGIPSKSVLYRAGKRVPCFLGCSVAN